MPHYRLENSANPPFHLIFTLDGVKSIIVGRCRFLAYSSHFFLTIAKAFLLISNLQSNALANPSKVISSKVGPNPPVTIMNCGFRFTDSQITLAISSTVSCATVIRLTSAPRFVACLLSQWAFVLRVLPISNSLPMQIISISTVMVLRSFRGGLIRIGCFLLYRLFVQG